MNTKQKLQQALKEHVQINLNNISLNMGINISINELILSIGEYSINNLKIIDEVKIYDNTTNTLEPVPNNASIHLRDNEYLFVDLDLQIYCT